MDVDDYLLLSGIQHFAFCKRQWALIHLEQVWSENYLTISGRIMHKNADDPLFTESRGDVLVSRAVPLISHKLKIYGIADVIEYHRRENGFKIPKRDGFWNAVPIEYKSGQKKHDNCDEVQLCCQAMCLEEMTQTEIPHGYLYYGKNKRRVEVIFDENLRECVESLISDMYYVLEHSITPMAELKKACESCSLVNICVPQLSSKPSVESYISRFV